MEFVESNWFILSIVAGFVAKSIGRSFWKYFFLSLFLSPIVGFIVLLIKGRKTDNKAYHRYEEAHDTEPINHSTIEYSAAEEIEKLKGLLDRGIITQDEFEAKKKQLLGL